MIRFNLLLLNDEYREKETIHEETESVLNVYFQMIINWN